MVTQVQNLLVWQCVWQSIRTTSRRDFGLFYSDLAGQQWPHIYYRWLREKKDFSRIFFEKEALLRFMAQSATVKKAFYLYLVRNAELLRGTGKEVFSRSSLEKLNALLPQYPKGEKQWKDLRALMGALEDKSNEEIARELGISGQNDVNKRFKPAMDLAFQHDIFQLEWLLLARERALRKKRGVAVKP